MIVVPPMGAAYEHPAVQAEIEEALTSQFPQFVWLVVGDRPPRGDAFVLMPLLGTPKEGLLNEPPAELLRQIHAFLKRTFALHSEPQTLSAPDVLHDPPLPE